MNYKKLYDAIIQNARSQNRERNKYSYYEEHHILPKCKGGSNDSSNLVLLSFREHFICHLLLVKINQYDPKLVFALNALCQNERMTSRMYAKIRVLYINMLKNNKDWKTKIANTMCKKVWMKRGTTNIRVFDYEIETYKNKGYSPGRIIKSRKSPSEETRQKISKSNLGKSPCQKAIDTLKKKQSGKTYEQIYGIEKAKELKELRRKKMIETNKKKISID
jgi:hypothetical protein